MFFLVIFLNIFSSYFAASYAKSVLSFFVAFFAIVVFNMEILSLFSAMEAKNILVLSILEALFAIYFQRKKKFPLLKFNLDALKEKLKRIKNALLLDKSLLAATVAFFILIFVTLFLALVVPVLEPDSQTYHFYRAVQFVSQKNLSHIETNDIRALIMPINSEIFYAWMLAFKKNFLGYGILSFFSFVAVICAISEILSHFKFSVRQILWTIFIFSSLSAVIVQIPALQTDITVGALLILSLAIFLETDSTSPNLFYKKIFFSSLALALAGGTKSTGLIALPGFFVLISGISYFIKNEKNLKSVHVFLAFFVLNFLIFSSYNYILNIIDFHNPFSNRAAYLGHRFWGGFRGFVANIVHFTFQSLDFTGFKWGYYLNDKIFAMKLAFFKLIHINPATGCNVAMEKVNIITDEQVAGFGILGFLVFLPSIFLCFSPIFKIFKKPKNKRITFLSLVAASFLINIASLSLSVAYMVFSIRFIVAFVALSAVCTVVSYRKKAFFKPLILFFMLFYMILIPTHIKRMPFMVIADNLKKNDFNLNKFEHDCYRSAITPVLELAPEIYNTIFEKYKDAKKIAVFKTTDSSLLYLKTLENKGIKVDFRVTSSMADYDLKSYDLIILEGEVQDDNIFNPEDVEINYKIKNGKIIFDDLEGVKCCFVGESTSPEESISRKCIGLDYMRRNPDFTEDLVRRLELKTAKNFVNIYYFKNRKFSDKMK